MKKTLIIYIIFIIETISIFSQSYEDLQKQNEIILLNRINYFFNKIALCDTTTSGSNDYNNHIVEYLGNNIIVESADNGIGVRRSTIDKLLTFYNSHNYIYEITYYRPRSYKK